MLSANTRGSLDGNLYRRTIETTSACILMKEIGGASGVYKRKWQRMELNDYTLTTCFPFLHLFVLLSHYLRCASYPSSLAPRHP